MKARIFLSRFLHLLFVLILSCMFFPLRLFGQKAKNMVEDVVYVKNGDIFIGQIIESKENEYVKIELIGGSVFVINAVEIDSIGQQLKRNVTRLYQKNKKAYPILVGEGAYITWQGWH